MTREAVVSRDRNHYNFQTEVRVRLSETDAVGIVFFGSYTTFMDVGRMDYLNHLGLTRHDGHVRDLIPGAVVHASMNYHEPARYNDVLILHVRIAHLSVSSYTFHFLIENKRDRHVCVTGVMTLVWLDDDFKTIPLPDDFRNAVEDFEPALSE